MRSLRASFVVASVALALFGLGRFVFNLVAVRRFGPEFVGSVNVSLSSWTVATILLGTVPAFLTSKFVSESVARGEHVRAHRLFSAALAAVVVPGITIALVVTAVRPGGAAIWAWYVPLFGAYLVMKSAAFAFGAQRSYLVAEFIGFAAFGIVCGLGCWFSSPRIAESSLLVQPAAVVMVTAWGVRDRLAWHGVLGELISGWRDYGTFWSAIFVNAAAGLVSYHMAVVLAGAILVDRAEVGYLSVLLSSLAPLNLLPAALGTSLFPEIARRYGAGDEVGQRRAVVGSTLALQAMVVTVGTALLLTAEPTLRLIHVPAEGAVRTTWIVLAWVLQLTIVSSPCGHFLNATRFAGRHAVASLLFLAVGVAAGIVGYSALGLIGAGLMRIGVDAGLAWVRMGIAERSLRWIGEVRGAVVGCQAALVSAMLIGLLAPAWPWRLVVWFGGVATQVPALWRNVSSGVSTPR